MLDSVLITLLLHGHVVFATNTIELFQYLFKNSSYNKNLRPVLHSTTQMNITVDFSVVAIVDFNEIEETITLTGFLSFRWTDEFLVWEPEKFGNLTFISVPQTFIWKPYVVLENSMVKAGEFGTDSLQVVIEHTGKVKWKPMEVFTVSCPADVYRFPFDSQTCQLIFEPSGYSLEEVKLVTSARNIDFHEYEGMSGWTIASSQIIAMTRHSDSYAIFSLTLDRKPLYFLMNIFLPILLLSILNMFVFLLPVESGEKASYAVTVFLALAVFLTIVSGKLPENSEKISLLNIYVFESTLLSTLITIVTIALLRIHNRDPSIPVPNGLKQFVRHFPGYPHPRISDFNINSSDQMKSPSENGNNNLTTSGPTRSKEDDPLSETVTWPDVVATFDKMFFVVFLLGYFIITVSLMGIAARKSSQ